jgi:hypothetical protein
MKKGKKMDARISCTTQVRDALREVCKGANVDYDDVLRDYLNKLGVDPSNPVQALRRGLDLRGSIPKYEDPAPVADVASDSGKRRNERRKP